jgi:hypothetical protein
MLTAKTLTPLQLWKQLEKDAGLELNLRKNKRGRDADLEEEVLNRLDPAAGTSKAYSSLSDLLIADMGSSSPRITVERLLIALLDSQRGFGSMMKEILDTLIIANARIGEHVLSCSFKFDEQSDPIVLTLEQFREQVEKIRTVLVSRYQLPDFGMRWDLSGALSRLRPKRTQRPPNSLSSLPSAVAASTGYPALDESLIVLTDLVTEFLVRCSQYGTDRRKIFDVVREKFPDTNVPAHLAELHLATDATDFWDVNIIESIDYITQGLRNRELDAQSLAADLRPLLSNIKRKQSWEEKSYNELLDILNLPTWRKRHELYSVWVGTVLLRTANQYADNMQFHPENGILSFAFGGSRLATYSWGGETLDIYAELRTDLTGTSTKRKKSIQPDFRVVRANSSASLNDATRLVLECKHYLRPSSRNFSQAANDYARSCHYSTVLIVNHGPADPVLLAAGLESELSQRVRFINDTQPGNSVETLETTLTDTLFASRPPIKNEKNAVPERIALSKDRVATIRLEWDETLQDIDLALLMHFADSGDQNRIDYGNRGSHNSAPYAQLLEDIRQGPGSETIEISKWQASAYRVVVKNYSKNGELRPGHLRCHVSTRFASISFECPELNPTADTWHVATITISNGLPIISTVIN